MPKKTLSVLLSVLMCLTMLPMKISAENLPEEEEIIETEKNDFNNKESSETEPVEENGELLNATTGVLEYSLGSNGEATVIDCDESATSVVIPDTIVGYPVTSIGSDAFYNCKNLTSVEIPNSVTKIGSYAFKGCSSLKSIRIPEGVTIINQHTFDGCISITNISILGKITSIDSYAFVNCESLTNINIPESVTNIGMYSFENCTGLQTAGPIGGGYNYEFGWTKKIPAYAFYQCSGLVSIKIPEEVESIGDNAFCGCTSLLSIEIPDSVTNINDYLLYECESLESVFLPESINNIGKSAFAYCYNLRDITIPNGVATIGYEAFRYCSKLNDITIPDSVTSIEDSAFYGCSGLRKVIIPRSITQISRSLFYKCTQLENVSIPNTVTRIGEYAFSCCESLDKIVIPDSVTYLGEGAFKDCSDLEDVTLSIGITQLNYETFSYCGNLAEITIPNSVTIISGRVFNYCNNLSKVTIPNSVSLIGGWAFEGCSNLRGITIPASVTAINKEAFNGCYNLISVYFKGDAPTIADDVFSGCYEISGYYPTNNSTWTNDIFQNYGAESITWKTWDPGSGSGDDTSNPFFIIGKNTNTFPHEDVNEAGKKYRGPQYLFPEPILYGDGFGYPVIPSHYLNLLAMCKTSASKKKLINWMNKEWGGSCYGLLLTIIFASLNKMSLAGYMSRSGNYIPENYSDLASPVDDVNLLSIINYYFLLQFTDYKYPNGYLMEQRFNPSKEEFISFWRDLYFSAKRACNNKNPLGFAYGVKSTDDGPLGHIVLIANCSETKERYVFYLYDCNEIEHFKILSVDKTTGELHWLRYYSIGGYQEISSTQWDGDWLYFRYADFSTCNPYTPTSNNINGLRKVSDDPGTQLYINSGKNLRIVNDKGDYLEYKEGLLSGDMDIIDQNYMYDVADLMVRVPSSDFFVVDQIEGTMSLDIVDGDMNKFYSIEETGADKVYFHIDKGIGLAGDDVEYTAYFGTEEDDPSVIKISGNSTADVSFIQKDNEISVQSEDSADEVSISVLSKEGIEEKGTEIVTEDQIIDSQGNVEEAPEGTAVSLHDFDDPKFVWCEDTCTASVTCKDDGYTEEYDCEITEGTIDGEETLTATVTINGKEYSTTKKKNEGIYLNKKELVLWVEKSETLVPTIHPEGMELIWSSSDESVATVDQNGKVTAAADDGIGTPSTAVITVSANDGSYIAKCTVTVEDPINGFVRRLYKLCFNRTADPGGFNKWTGELRSKKNTAAATVQFFFTSKEFNNLQLDNEAFVEMCYKVMMDRASDAGGKKNWLDKLDAGVSQAYVLKGFIGSREFANICMDYGIERGTIKLTEARDQNLGITQFVSRNYSEVLGRKADVGGLNNWCKKILTAVDKKQEAINTASNGFFHSPEYMSKNTTNDQYVKTLYRTFLGREADTGGYNNWMKALNSGQSRDSVMNGFAYSTEFANIMAKYGIK